MGSGGAPTKTEPSSEEPSYTAPDPGGYEPAPPAQPAISSPPTVKAAESADRATSGGPPAKPPAEADRPAKVAKVSVDAATPIAHPESPQAGDVSGTPAAKLTDPEDQQSSGSNALTLLFLVVVGLAFGYACFRLWRRHQRSRIEALQQRRDATWKAVVHQIEMERTLGESAQNGHRPKIDVG